MDALDAIRRQIASGKREGPRRALMTLLRNHPHDVTAWMLLATVLDDPQQQADCYRQVLSLDPGNQQAARALDQLRASRELKALRCPQCGGGMEVYFAGELRDKRARCRYCGSEVDLSDRFQRVQRTQASEQGAGVRRFEDTVVVESRSDGGVSPSIAEDIARLALPRDREGTSVEELSELLRSPHAFTKEDIQRLLARHDITISDGKLDEIVGRYVFSEREAGSAQRVVVRRIESRALGEAFASDRTEPQGCLSLLAGLFGETRVILERSRPSPPPETSVETIIKAAGEPLPPDERRRCPQCGATLSKQATRCGWCDTWLDDAEA
ncbi:MAG: hypothetical protein ACP5JG_08960 [Anaerolineae bacterium]